MCRGAMRRQEREPRPARRERRVERDRRGRFAYRRTGRAQGDAAAPLIARRLPADRIGWYLGRLNSAVCDVTPFGGFGGLPARNTLKFLNYSKPVQKPHPPVIVGGAFRLAARRAIRYGDGILPAAPSAGSGGPDECLQRFRQMAEEAGRDPGSLSVTLGGAPEDLAVLRRNRDLGVSRMTVRLPPTKEDEILPILDRWAKLIPRVQA